MKKSKTTPVISVVLYVMAYLMAAYFIFSAIYCTDIVVKEINEGKIKLFSNFYGVASYYMQYSVVYFVYSSLCYAAALLCGKFLRGNDSPGVNIVD